MKLTIIETGQPPPPLRARFPSYPEMFAQMFSDVGAELAFETVSLVRGEKLPDPAGLEAVLYTGSPAGVYDPEPWMEALMMFIRAAAAAQRPQVGICFGHQVMAEALGGKVMKSEKGWGIGAHTYALCSLPYWKGEAGPGQMRIAVSHQDQVVRIPPAGQCIASSGFTPLAGLSYAGFPALSFQCHPEFTPGFAAALYDVRRERLGEEAVNGAIASLGKGGDRLFLAQWIAGFLSSGGQPG